MRSYTRPVLTSALLVAALPAALLTVAAQAASPPSPPSRPEAGQARSAALNFDELDCEGPEEDRLPSTDSGQGAVHEPGTAAFVPAPLPAGLRPAVVKWPKNLPDLEDAKRMLSELDVGPFDSKGFQRTAFGGKSCWVLHGAEKCSTRELALKALSDIPATIKDGCKVVGGRWRSAYDNLTVTNPLRVDIDHIVPLRAAWGSGARDWPEYKRRAFANDLSGSPQLIAVSTWSNRDKGDKGPDKWLPKGYECTYSRAWIGVKEYYGLRVTAGERSRLEEVLGDCRE